MKLDLGEVYLEKYAPGLRYWEMPKDKLDYRKPDNWVGYEQRAFIFYWALKAVEESRGGIGFEPGCGQAITPFCLGADKYAGPDHPEYGGAYHPHIMIECDKPLPFEDSCFDFLVSHHSLEHMEDTDWTLREWIRVVKPGGVLAIVMPDAKYPTADKGHKCEWRAEDFKREILDPLVEEGLVEIFSYNSFLNFFSFDCVLVKCPGGSTVGRLVREGACDIKNFIEEASAS